MAVQQTVPDLSIAEYTDLIRGAIRHNQALLNEYRDVGMGDPPAEEKAHILCLGDPGSGKTTNAIAAAIAESVSKNNIFVYNLQNYMVTDIVGALRKHDGSPEHVELFPDQKEGDWVAQRPMIMPPLSIGDEPCILVLDELPQAIIQSKAVAQLLSDGFIGPHKLPPNCTLILLGNRSSNRAGASDLPAHIPDRCFCGVLSPLADEVMDFLLDNQYRPEVVAYVAWIAASEQGSIFKFDPKAMISRTLRSFRKLNIALGMGLTGNARRKLIIAALGSHDGQNFLATEEAMKRFPDPDEILKDPDNAPIPAELDQQYAVAMKVSAALNLKNSAAIFRYINRFSQQEIAHTAVSSAIKRITRENHRRAQSGEMPEDIRDYPGFGDYLLAHQDLARALTAANASE